MAFGNIPFAIGTSTPGNLPSIPTASVNEKKYMLDPVEPPALTAVPVTVLSIVPIPSISAGVVAELP
ncbi:MAG: hypothetical protein JNJ56_14610 [Ignavibacteria bacterium]|nr:hypothetical protein [Ignavibacteria bacterium]